MMDGKLSFFQSAYVENEIEFHFDLLPFRYFLSLLLKELCDCFEKSSIRKKRPKDVLLRFLFF
jgi:hypothetical protein